MKHISIRLVRLSDTNKYGIFPYLMLLGLLYVPGLTEAVRVGGLNLYVGSMKVDKLGLN